MNLRIARKVFFRHTLDGRPYRADVFRRAQDRYLPTVGYTPQTYPAPAETPPPRP